MRAPLAKVLNPLAYLRFGARFATRLPLFRRVASNWPRWALRQLFLPAFSIPSWVHTRAGTRFFLGDDPIDDSILRHVMGDAVEMYFPEGVKVPLGRLILDVGAHHGIYAVEALRRNPGARLIAVEPNPAARPYFERNLEANGMLPRVEYVEGGLGDRSGEAFLAFAGESWEHTTVPPFGANAKGIPVRIHSVVDVLAGRTPYLVKLNAEGAEFEVMPAMLASGIRPEWMILMIHPHAGSAEELLELVARSGYQIIPADGKPNTTRVFCRLTGAGESP